MTMEAKKLAGAVGSALAGMAALSGIVLMALQIKTQGTGFFVGYLLYALAILAGGLFITWLPTMHNRNYGLRIEQGKPKWRKDTRIVDQQRTRLVLWPLITLFFELFGLFSYCHDLWGKAEYEVMQYLFAGLTLLILGIWIVIILAEEQRMKRQENKQEKQEN